MLQPNLGNRGVIATAGTYHYNSLLGSKQIELKNLGFVSEDEGKIIVRMVN
jgi:predicted small integral membrane protein